VIRTTIFDGARLLSFWPFAFILREAEDLALGMFMAMRDSPFAMLRTASGSLA
jgi:hypothetical protein